MSIPVVAASCKHTKS
nr:variable surface lipoprotein [Mycoplasmopsis bovis]